MLAALIKAKLLGRTPVIAAAISPHRLGDRTFDPSRVGHLVMEALDLRRGDEVSLAHGRAGRDTAGTA